MAIFIFTNKVCASFYVLQVCDDCMIKMNDGANGEEKESFIKVIHSFTFVRRVRIISHVALVS